METQSSLTPDGDQNRTGEILKAAISFLVVSFILVMLRLYTRLFLVKSARWDDWTIVLAMVLSSLFGLGMYLLTSTKLGSLIGAGLVVPEIRDGFGRHWQYLTTAQRQEFMRYTFGEWIQTFFTLMITKVSVCLLLLRISPNIHIIRPIQCLVAFLILSNIVLSLVWIFQCIPVHEVWNCDSRETTYCKRPTRAKCFSQGQVQRVIISQASKLRGRVASVCRR